MHYDISECCQECNVGGVKIKTTSLIGWCMKCCAPGAMADELPWRQAVSWLLSASAAREGAFQRFLDCELFFGSDLAGRGGCCHRDAGHEHLPVS